MRWYLQGFNITLQQVAKTEGIEMDVFCADSTLAQNWLKQHAQKSKSMKAGGWEI